MDGVGMQLQGERELQRTLDALDDSLQRKITKSALTKAATPIVKEMRRRAPVGRPRVKYPGGNLKKAMGKRVVKYPSGVIVAVIGPRWPQGAHGHLVEFGTAPRYSKAGAYKGQMPAKAFARPAFELHKRSALNQIAVEVWDGIAQEAERARSRRV
jgi:HK97 gp10 family phage protein